MACPQKVVIPKGMVGPCETAIVEIPAELKDVDTVVAKPRTPCPAASLPPGARNARSWPPRSGKRRHHFPQPGESFVEGIPCTPEEPSYDESFAAALPTGAANARTWPPRSGKRPQHFPQLGGSFVEGIPCTPEEPSYDESFAAALPTGAANARTWPPRSGKRRHHYPQPGGSFEGVPSTPEESSYDESFQETYDTIYEEVQDLEVCELNTAIARVRSFQAARRGFIAAAACVSTVEDVIRTKGKKFLKSAKKGLQRCRLFPTEKGFYDPSAAAGKPKPGRKKFMPQTGTYPVWQKYDDALTRSPGYTPQKGSYSPWNVAVGDSRYPTKQETNIPSPKRRITPAMYYYNWFPREKGIATPPKRRDMRKLKKYYQGYEDCSC